MSKWVDGEGSMSTLNTTELLRGELMKHKTNWKAKTIKHYTKLAVFCIVSYLVCFSGVKKDLGHFAI